MRQISQVHSAVKSISGVGDSWCKGSGVGSSWACSRNWKERRLEQTERGGSVVAAMTRVKIGTRSQEASETPKMIVDFISNEQEAIVEFASRSVDARICDFFF